MKKNRNPADKAEKNVRPPAGHASSLPSAPPEKESLGIFLEKQYKKWNRREFIHPDPLEFIYQYSEPDDIEITALLASSLAYGRVSQILTSIRTVLAILKKPAAWSREKKWDEKKEELSSFRHRFADGLALAGLLHAAGRLLQKYGSLENAFAAGFSQNDKTVLPALEKFSSLLRTESPVDPGHLVARTELGSACKRMNLMLRWLVRRDDVDPGIWKNIKPSRLIVPLDVHMHRVCKNMNICTRRAVDMKTALAITESFRKWCPTDPVKYDFSLTRPGIRGKKQQLFPNHGMVA